VQVPYVCNGIAVRSRLFSWWDMKPFPVTNFLSIVRNFQEAISNPEFNSADPLREEDIRVIENGSVSLIQEAEECGLPLTADQFARIRKVARQGSNATEINQLGAEMMNRLEDECNRHLVMLIEKDYAQYFSNAQFFDSQDANAKKVSLQFPDAAEDVAEAGKCLACSRSTACVMHLLRVMECGLKALAAKLGIPEQNDWGKYLSEIEKALERRMKSAGARTQEEQFYAEAHAMFDSVRRAWRNPTMHVAKTYTEERANEILIAVRSFMRHLATNL
jgi:hypothetical protein